MADHIPTPKSACGYFGNLMDRAASVFFSLWERCLDCLDPLQAEMIAMRDSRKSCKKPMNKSSAVKILMCSQLNRSSS